LHKKKKNSSIKLGLIFIAVGLIAGGVVEVLYEPISTFNNGWIVEDFPSSSESYSFSIKIPDINNDSVDDYFYWQNAYENQIIYPSGFIINGSNGKLLANKTFIELEQYFQFGNEPILSDNGKIIFFIIPYENGFDFQKIKLIQINPVTLNIDKNVSLLETKWEDELYFNQSYPFYTPTFTYLKNITIPAPGSDYVGNIIAFESQFPNWNGSTYNKSQLKYTFINPNTLETVSEITLNKTNYVDYGWCYGPLTSLDDKMLRYPYFFIRESNTFSLVSLDNIGNYTINKWLINNQSSPELMDYAITTKCYISLNSSGNPTGISVFQPYENKFLSYHFANPSNIIKTFEIKESEDLLNVIQIKTQSIGKETSFALIFDDPNSEVRMDIGVNYKYYFYNQSIVFLDGEASGVVKNTSFLSVSDYEIFSYKIGGDSRSYFMGYPEYYFCPIDFDVDADNKTDVIMLGLSLNKSEILRNQVNNEVITGPFFVLTQQKVINQTIFWSDYVYDPKIYAVGDSNNDEILDVMFEETRLLFSSNYPKISTNLIDSKLEGGSRPYFIIGAMLICIGLIMLILCMLLMGKIDIQVVDRIKYRHLLMIFIASVLMLFIYTLLLNVIRINSQGFLLQSEETIAIQVLNNAANSASFILFTFIPITAGVYVLITPHVSKWIIKINRFLFNLGKKKLRGKKQSNHLNQQEKHAKLDKIQEIGEINSRPSFKYEIIMIPPFGRKSSKSEFISRFFSVIALTLSIGLIILNSTHIDTIVKIRNIQDPNFIEYITLLFRSLIIPGILSSLFFFWLVPTSWLLDDSGIMFYHLNPNSLKPEEVEPIGVWFSSYLKGFIGISAILSYYGFVRDSPILDNISNFESNQILPIIGFIFGFIVMAGLVVGVLVVFLYDLTLPDNISRLYSLLKEDGTKTKRRTIKFEEVEELSHESIENGLKEAEKPYNKKNLFAGTFYGSLLLVASNAFSLVFSILYYYESIIKDVKGGLGELDVPALIFIIIILFIGSILSIVHFFMQITKYKKGSWGKEEKQTNFIKIYKFSQIIVIIGLIYVSSFLTYQILTDPTKLLIGDYLLRVIVRIPYYLAMLNITPIIVGYYLCWKNEKIFRNIGKEAIPNNYNKYERPFRVLLYILLIIGILFIIPVFIISDILHFPNLTEYGSGESGIEGVFNIWMVFTLILSILLFYGLIFLNKLKPRITSKNN